VNWKRTCSLLLSSLAMAQCLPAQDLAQQVIKNELRQLGDLEEYTFDYELEWMFHSRNGAVHKRYTESGESFMSRRRSIDIALVKNGKQQSPNTVSKARKAALAKFEEDAKAGNHAGLGTLSPNGPAPGLETRGVRMSSIDILRYCKLGAPTEAGDKLEIRFDGCDSPWPSEAHFPRIEGSLLVDSKTRLIASWRARIKDGPSPGALFFEQATQTGPDNVRLLASNRLNTNSAPHLFPRDRFEVLYRWRRPKRFNVDTKQTVVEPKLTANPQ